MGLPKIQINVCSSSFEASKTSQNKDKVSDVTHFLFILNSQNASSNFEIFHLSAEFIANAGKYHEKV